MEDKQPDITNEMVVNTIMKKVHDNASPSRAVAFDPKKQFAYDINKGLRKPGRISFEVLRRAANAVHIARICVNVLKEKVTKTEWAIQPIDPLQKTKEDPRIQEVEDFFKHPNTNNETFRTLLDKMLEDLLVLDAVCVEKTRFPDGRIAELHYVDAATVRPVFDTYGNQDIEIPLTTEEGNVTLPVSYVQVMDNSQYGGPESGHIVAAWPKKDFLYFNMHPQGSMNDYGYGLSPLESVISVVGNILNADNYNGTYFEEGAFPPIILQLMTNMNERDLDAMRAYLDSELSGRFHRPAIVAGEKEVKVTSLKDMSNTDMQFMEYMKFMARLLAAAYGLSGQDIGLTDDLNKAISETQKDLSEQKGYSSVLHLLKEVFNQEILWKDFGYTDLEFDWVQQDSIDPQIASQIYDTFLKNGSLTLNEVRQKIGEAPYGEFADIPMLLTTNGYIPLRSTEDGKGEQESSQIDGDNKAETMDENDKDGDVGNEEIYEDQAESQVDTVNKSVYTQDGYKCFVDDRGYGQPFICFDAVKRTGYVIKPPIAVNVHSQDLEVKLSGELKAKGANVPQVTKMSEVDIRTHILPTPLVFEEFTKYQNMTPEYDSEKWRAKFGGSRKYAMYLVSEYIEGRSLKDPILIEDMRRDPKSYTQAVKDLAILWKIEKQMMLGDRRSDQYLVTPEKRAYGIDYQFEGDKKRWEDSQFAIHNALLQIPSLRKVFIDGIEDEKTLKSIIARIRKGIFGVPQDTSTASFQDTPVMFGELVRDDLLKQLIKNLFEQDSVALVNNYGFRELSFVYDFNRAVSTLKDFVKKFPESYGGVVISKDISGVKYFVYVKDQSQVPQTNQK